MATIQTIPQVIFDKLPLIVSSTIVFLAVYVLKYLLTPDPLANIPVIRQELDSDHKRREEFKFKAKELYADGYKKFQNGFRIISARKSPVVVLSTKFLDELKRLPDDVLSFDAAIEQSMHTKYTQLPSEPQLPHTIKTSLTPGLVRLNPTVADEVKEAIRTELPPCTDWTPVNINAKLLRIVAMASGRILIGPELCRSEEYLDAAIKYTMEVMEVRGAVDNITPWLRPFKAPFVPELKKLNNRLKEVDAFMKPIVQARFELTDSDKKPDDMLQWLIDDQKRMGGEWSTLRQARLQLGITFAAIHTTTLTTTNVFYNLAAYPEYIPELRDEIRSALAETGGVFTTPALQAMKKLDSFLKETMRADPLGIASFERKVLKTFALSSGQVIPAGTVIEVPSYAIANDPEIYSSPEKFDGLRFYNMRQKAKEAGQFEAAAQGQFVSVSQSSLSFGYGRHACPGRFFAGNEIKMIVANCLLQFDIKLAEGQTERYRNFDIGGSSIPDPTKELLFKKIAA